MNLFEVATREKYRYPYKGTIATEDLWDLTLPQLDSIFKTLNAQVKVEPEESLLETPVTVDPTLSNQIAILRYIVAVKQREQKVQESAAAMQAQRQKLLGLIVQKQDESLASKSAEELKSMLAELGE